MRRWVRRIAVAAAVLGIGALVLPRAMVALLRDGPSRCQGSAAEGWLENGVSLTGGGAARPYCWVCARLLRTYGHDRAVAVVDAAYAEVARAHPRTDWIYGESGFPWGGR